MEFVSFFRFLLFHQAVLGLVLLLTRGRHLAVPVKEKALSYKVIPDPAADTLEQSRDYNSSMT